MSKWIQEQQTALFEKLGVFFAFSQQQFNESKQPGVEYCSVLGAGDCVPSMHKDYFIKHLNKIHEEGRKRLIEEKGLAKIIEEELANHECYYTGDIEPAIDALAAYGVTRESVASIFQATRRDYE